MIKGSEELKRWVPGETPTFIECPHGVKILEGFYLRKMTPTGEHGNCLAEFLRVDGEDQ